MTHDAVGEEIAPRVRRRHRYIPHRSRRRSRRTHLHRRPLLTNRRLRPSTCAMVCRRRRRAARRTCRRLSPRRTRRSCRCPCRRTYPPVRRRRRPPLCRSANRPTLRRLPRAHSRACCLLRSRRTYRRPYLRRLPLSSQRSRACAAQHRLSCAPALPPPPAPPLTARPPALPAVTLAVYNVSRRGRCVTDPPSPTVDSDPRNTTVEQIQARFPWVYGEITLAQNNTKHRVTPTNQPATTPAPPRRRGRSPQNAAAGPGGPRQSRRAPGGTSGSRGRRRSATRPRS